MNNRNIIMAMLAALAALASPSAFAGEDDTEGVGSRVSVEVDKKLAKGFHISLSEEARFVDFSAFDRTYTTLGLSYKVNPYLKFGASYTAIGVNDTEFEWRHRGNFYVTEMFRAGDFKFNFREMFQATYKAYEINTYQKPQTALALRARFKVSYDIPNCHLEPYAAFEARYFLNGAYWENQAFVDHSDAYINRLRGNIGVEWNISKKHALEFYGLYDHLMDCEIDSNKEGTKLKSIENVTSNRVSIGVGYKFSF